MGGWQPSPDERRAIRAAARSLEVWTGWLWADDLKQAALIGLWETQDKRATYTGSAFAVAFGFARNSMRQEWRRITERHVGTKFKPGQPVEFVDVQGGGVDNVTADHDTPESALERVQCIEQAMTLPEPLAQVLSARLEHDSMREAAVALDIAQAAFQTRLYRALRALADQHAGRDVIWVAG